MKYIKVYENFYNWKVGDIIVAVTTKYADGTYWIHEGNRYEIVEIAHDNTTVLVKDTKPDKYGIFRTYENYFLKNNFITEEEYIKRETIKNYNL